MHRQREDNKCHSQNFPRGGGVVGRGARTKCYIQLRLSSRSWMCWSRAERVKSGLFNIDVLRVPLFFFLLNNDEIFSGISNCGRGVCSTVKQRVFTSLCEWTLSSFLTPQTRSAVLCRRYWRWRGADSQRHMKKGEKKNAGRQSEASIRSPTLLTFYTNSKWPASRTVETRCQLKLELKLAEGPVGKQLLA